MSRPLTAVFFERFHQPNILLSTFEDRAARVPMPLHAQLQLLVDEILSPQNITISAEMRMLPLPKQLLRAVTYSWRHAQLEETGPIDTGSTELDDLCTVEINDLVGFRGTIELRYETEVCRRRSQRPSWASNPCLDTATNSSFQQIKQPSTAMPLTRHQSSKSMSSRLPASSFAQSVGPNVGRSNSMIGRSQTSMSFHRSTDARQPPNASRMRPKTAMTTHPVEENGSPSRKQSCTMLPVSFRSSTQSAPPNALPERRLRKAASVQFMGPRASAPGRDFSITTMMGNLSLNDERPNGIFLTRDQAISTKENCPPSPSPLQSSEFLLENVTLRPAQSRREDSIATPVVRPEDSRASIMAPPKTPPDSAQHALDLLDKFEETLLASTRKCPESPSKSPSKVVSFLTKDSNLTAFTAWDMDDRLVEMEAQFKAMKDVMNVSLTDKKAMEEVIDMAKTRGRHLTHQQKCIGYTD